MMSSESLRLDFGKVALEDKGQGSLRLRWVGWLLNELERREMLVSNAVKPGHWSEDGSVTAAELVRWLQKHLNVVGWRALLEQVRRHNEAGNGKSWNLSSPHDVLDAIEAMLLATPVLALGEASPETQGGIVAGIREQDDTLKVLGTMLPVEASGEKPKIPRLAWLLAPRAAASVVRAQATSAQALAELERARSEAMLHALRIVETDARSSAVLAQIEDLRKRLGSRLIAYCHEHGLPVPQPGSEEEANLLFLLNAQLIALEDAREEIARRGAALAREQIRLAEKSARESMEARSLPLQLEAKTSANPVRERLLYEERRHRSARWAAQAIGTIGGALSGLFTAALDIVATSIADTILVSGPPLLVFVATLVAETVAHEGELALGDLLGFAVAALWNGFLMLLLTLTGFAFWRYLNNKHRTTSTARSVQEPRWPEPDSYLDAILSRENQ